MAEELKIDVGSLKKRALVIRAVDNKLRQKMLHLIDKHKRITVTEIYEAFKIQQSAASQHLAILRKEGFIKAGRDRRYQYYSIDYQRFKEMGVFIDKVLDKERVLGSGEYCAPVQLKDGLVVRKRV